MAKNTEKENETAASAENTEKEAEKEACPAVDPALEMVDVFVERDPSDENPNLVIGINGKFQSTLPVGGATPWKYVSVRKHRQELGHAPG